MSFRTQRGQGRDDGSAPVAVQRKPAPGKTTLTQSLPPRSAPPETGGQSLPDGVRTGMERSFEADFQGVRVHQGAHVEAAGAHAYASGSDLHFAPGRYDPTSAVGLDLLGHELAHVVQQRQGRVGPTVQARGLTINDDSS